MVKNNYMFLLLLIISIVIPTWCGAVIVEYDLTIDTNTVNYSGKPVSAMTINGKIPGPVLDFIEGDVARIRVHNAMSVDSSIHWHGMLVPPEMDGVPLISFPPIAPNTTFTYEFPIRQSGTYWYHSHTSLQEQRGVYGAIKILPREVSVVAPLDRVVMLSDWTDVDPHEVLRTLKRGSDWMTLEKGSAQSILGAAKLGQFGHYFSRELQRMPAMDIADISYDRFLVNGQPQLEMNDTSGQMVRLRFVNGGAGTNFYLQFSGGPMTIISADGQPVEAIDEQRFLIAIAETYDVVVHVPADGAYELRATAHDGSGFASVWLGSGARYSAPSIPPPNLYHKMGTMSWSQLFALTPAGSMGMNDRAVNAGMFDQPGMAAMPMVTMDHSGSAMAGQMDHKVGHSGQQMMMNNAANVDATEMSNMDHAGMMGNMGDRSGVDHSLLMTGEASGKPFTSNFYPMAADVARAESLAVDGMDARRPWPLYHKLRSPHATALTTDLPIREVRLTLDGDMERYVWFLNNRPLAESDAIKINEGEVVRFIMINRTMMHHPMHLHGHFFRVINGQGDFAPLKHTVNVAPMSTTVIEFKANEVGDWFFHCHLLYHMKSGMARVVHYENFILTDEVAAIRPQLYSDSWYFWGQVELLNNMLEGQLTASDSRNTFHAEWDLGWQHVDGSEWEALLTWDRYLNRFFSLFAGVNIGDAIEKERAVIGLHYLLPFNLESQLFVGSDGEVRAEVSRSFELTPRLSIDGLVQYETSGEWESVVGASYLLTKGVSLRGQWHSDYHWGGGFQVRF